MAARQRASNKENWPHETYTWSNRFPQGGATLGLLTGAGGDSAGVETPRAAISGPLWRRFAIEYVLFRFEIPITSEARKTRLVAVGDGVDIAALDTSGNDNVIPITPWVDIGGTSFEGANLSGDASETHAAIVFPIIDTLDDTNEGGNVIPEGYVLAWEFDGDEAATGLGQFSWAVRGNSYLK